MWQYDGSRRPPFAFEPEEGQESVWDYTRPPTVDYDLRKVRVGEGRKPLAYTSGCYRLLETASPPAFYLTPTSVDFDRLIEVERNQTCEYKGKTTFWALKDNPDLAIAWCYREPTEPYKKIKNFMSFFPGRIPCYVSDMRVKQQHDGFYGGWVTHEIVGPWKGEPGSENW